MAARQLTPGLNKATVDAIFQFLKQRLPWASDFLTKLNNLVDGNLPQLKTYQVNRGVQTLSADNVKQFVDSLFAFAETLESGNAWLVSLTMALNSFIDATVLQQLVAWLEQQGIITA